MQEGYSGTGPLRPSEFCDGLSQFADMISNARTLSDVSISFEADPAHLPMKWGMLPHNVLRTAVPIELGASFAGCPIGKLTIKNGYWHTRGLYAMFDHHRETLQVLILKDTNRTLNGC